jgi:virulence factor Mce-like protein
MRTRPNRGILTNSPVLVGAVTVLVVLVAVFLSYNANEGLPFVPTRTLYLELPDGSNLTKGNEVRRGGYRVGFVKTITYRQAGVQTVAVATIVIDGKFDKIPVDSHFSVRAKSALGIKYVDIEPGKSTTHFAADGTIPVGQSSLPVQIDDFTSTFDDRTRVGMQKTLGGLGDAFAGRGVGLNETFGELPDLLPKLAAVMATLRDPDTRLAPFIDSADRLVRVLAPVADRQAHLFGVAATTFSALVADPDAYRDTIDEGARTEADAIPALRKSRPFLTHAAALGEPIATSAAELDASLPDLDAAVRSATPVSLRTPAFDDRLSDTLDAVDDLATEPGTYRALTGSQATVKTLQPQLRYYGPFFTVCNYWNYFWTDVADAGSVKSSLGQSFHAIVANAPEQVNGLGVQGAKRPVNGGAAVNGASATLHGQPGGAAVNTDGTADCEAVQRGYPSRLASYAAPDLNITVDAHTPGSQGPVYKNFDDLNAAKRKLGVLRVPAGETFVRSPQTGPQLPFEAEGGR